MYQKNKNKAKPLKVLDWVATQAATPRHMSRLLRLLPSGPGRVHRVSLRGDRKGHHRIATFSSRADYR